MPYTFGGTTNDSFGHTMDVTISATRAMFTYGWFYPTTLTADRRLYSISTSGVYIDTTTNQLRLKEDHATTDGEWTTSDAGLATSKWSFIATMWTPVAAGGAWRAWAGTVDTAPAELTVTSAVGISGALTTSSTFRFGGDGGGHAFQGDVAEIGFACGNATIAPMWLAAAGSITNAEADSIYRRMVLPAWEGKWAPRTILAGAVTAALEVGRCELNTLPVVLRYSMGNSTAAPNPAPTIIGSAVSKNGHPRPPLSSQLFYPSRRR